MRPLDGMRGIGACVIAFFFHYIHFLSDSNGLLVYSNHPLYFLFPNLVEYGWLAVELFLLLSGMTFATFYETRIHDKIVTGKQFFIARFSRIYPVYCSILLATVVIQLVYQGLVFENFHTQNNTLFNLFLSLLLMQSWGISDGGAFNQPTWTLSVEVLCYVIFYLVCRKIRKPIYSYIVLFLLTIVLFRNGFIIDLVARGLAVFFLGAISAHALPKLSKICQNKNIRIIVNILFVLSIIIGYLFWNRKNDLFGQSILEIGIAVSVFCFIPAIYLIINIPVLNKLFQLKPLEWLGKVSFSIYIIHFPVQTLLDLLNRQFLIGFDYKSVSFWLGYVLVSISVAIVVHYYIELPAKAWLRQTTK